PRMTGSPLTTPGVATPHVATADVATHVATADVAAPHVATADVAAPHVATPHVATADVAIPHVATPHVATPVVPSSAVASTSTAADASASDSVSTRVHLSSATRRVSMYEKINPVVVDKKMICMENKRFDEILSLVHCSLCFSKKIKVTYYNHHLETVLSISCTECKNSLLEKPYGIRKKLNTLTGRMVYAEMVTGGGYSSFARKNALCNLPRLGFETFNRYTSVITRISIQSCNKILDETRLIVGKEYAKCDILPDARGVLDIDVTYDGTWHTRGHNSNFGIGVAIDALTKLVVDYQVLCKYCFICSSLKNRLKKKRLAMEKYEQLKQSHESKCTKNFSGSSGKMEVEAALIIWQRSQKMKLRYKTIVSDGDSATYKGIVELNDGAGPYEGIHVAKEECINHYAKRLRKRLTSLVKLHYTEKQLRTGKKRKQYHQKKGMLTDFVIDKLAQYFQKNLRENRGSDVVTMRNGILASFFHCSSTDDNPQHQLCPPGSASWCFYKKALADNLPPPPHTTMKVQFQLEPAYFKKVHDIYKDLTRDEMMERCIQGRTQNCNESLHKRIWSYCNKALFKNKWQVDFATSNAIAEYNAGYERSCLDIQLGYGRSSLNQRHLRNMDKKMQAVITNVHKKRKRVVDTSYEAGGH
ncbi:hypothetical protein OTU49_016156, partial [Cherax quadricarinatus]